MRWWDYALPWLGCLALVLAGWLLVAAVAWAAVVLTLKFG